MLHPSDRAPARPSAPASVEPAAVTAQFLSRAAVAADLNAIEALHDRVFGPGALTRAAYRVREGQPSLTPYCRVLHSGEMLVAAIRLTRVCVGGVTGVLLLGPLAVAPEFANRGHGRRLVGESLELARVAGEMAVLLVGDLPYYAHFGFAAAPGGQIVWPAPVDPARMLILEFSTGAAARCRGRVAGAA